MIQNFRYRPEIDGLRAIAVTAVVLYHAGLGPSGGFVGVDVFFVISGFLITSFILRDVEAGTFTLAGFWERRIRRIVPALACLVFATLIAGWVILLPDDYSALGQSAFFQGLFVANIYFYRSSGYFDGTAEEKPLLHTWSLAVEEQFYFIFPLLMIGLVAIPKFHRRYWLLLLFGLLIVISLGLSIWGVSHWPVGTFYLLPTRAWELLLGGLVALLPAPTSFGNLAFLRRFKPAEYIREVLTGLALVGILASCWFYTSATPFPGMAAVLPCAAAAIFIWASGRQQSEGRLPLAARVLSARPIVFVGLISYSLYLWHWPLIAFSNYLSFGPLSLASRCSLVVTSFLLAILSWRFIETPFRTRRYCDSRRSIFAMGALATGLLVSSGLAVQFSYAPPQRFTAETLAYAKAKADATFIHELEIADIVAGRLTSIGASTPNAPVEWLVWGDSHAMAATPAFHEYLKARGIAGQAATHSWTAPLLGYFKGLEYGMGLDSLEFNQAVIEHVQRLAIKNVVLVGVWRGYEGETADHPNSGAFEESLVATVQAIHKAGARPWILLEIPSQGFDVPKVLAQYAMTNQPIEPLCAKPDPTGYSIVNTPGLVEQLKAAGATLLDPRPYCLSEDGTHYRVAQGGAALYRDAGHLSVHGAIVIVLPLLEDSLFEIQSRSEVP
ncbi:MAG TPA: acyltransferase [Planctomycetaceae bacterium]|nr:acyltransferase [Planctomycetaceae bacterium]